MELFVLACKNQYYLFHNGINVLQTCFVATTIGTLLLHKYSIDIFYCP